VVGGEDAKAVWEAKGEDMNKRWRLEISDGIRFGIGLALSQVILAGIVLAGMALLMGGCGAFMAALGQ